jgi:antitoxin (DNA-binding transcriptional repressor) of toxin-antitoxin stability system
MTIKLTVPQAHEQFTKLIEQVLLGEEIIIYEDRNDGIALARITAIHPPKQPRTPGQDRGKIFISPDFNDPLPDDILADFIG